MKKIFTMVIVLGLIWFGFFITPSLLHAAPGDVAARLRLYEGFRESNSEPGKIITSYYLKPLTDKDVFAEVDEGKEIEVLKRVFNMADVKLMTDALLVLGEGRDKTPFQVIVLNGRKLLVQMSKLGGQPNRFRVEVLEDMTPPRSLLNSTIILPKQKTTALGFEDNGGKIYFLSFHRGEDFPSAPPAPPSPAAPNTPKMPKVPNAPNASAWPAHAPHPPELPKPRLIQKVDPIFPAEAVKKHVSGTVVINATTDIDGNVKNTEVVSGPPLLIPAALDAIKQWKYEPCIVNGKKKEVTFTITIKFNLDNDDEAMPISNAQAPKVIKKVLPQYPVEAKIKHVQGTVVLEVVVDRDGNVTDAVVIDGIPELNDAAIGAVKQWKYESYLKNEKKQKIKFTVVVKFALEKK